MILKNFFNRRPFWFVCVVSFWDSLDPLKIFLNELLTDSIGLVTILYVLTEIKSLTQWSRLYFSRHFYITHEENKQPELCQNWDTVDGLDDILEGMSTLSTVFLGKKEYLSSNHYYNKVIAHFSLLPIVYYQSTEYVNRYSTCYSFVCFL